MKVFCPLDSYSYFSFLLYCGEFYSSEKQKQRCHFLSYFYHIWRFYQVHFHHWDKLSYFIAFSSFFCRRHETNAIFREFKPYKASRKSSLELSIKLSLKIMICCTHTLIFIPTGILYWHRDVFFQSCFADQANFSTGCVHGNSFPISSLMQGYELFAKVWMYCKISLF